VFVVLGGTEISEYDHGMLAESKEHLQRSVGLGGGAARRPARILAAQKRSSADVFASA
jgi:hypothetical protein